MIGEILYQGEDSRVQVETTLVVLTLYFGSFFWVYREETPVKKKSILKHINLSFKKISTRRTKNKTQATPIEPRPRQTQLVKVWIKKENACRF